MPKVIAMKISHRKMNRLIVAAIALEMSAPFHTWNFYYTLDVLFALAIIYYLGVGFMALYRWAGVW